MAESSVVKIDAALIGGTGVGDRLRALGGKHASLTTREGTIHGSIVSLSGKTCLLLERHSQGHRNPPHKVAYSAFALACQELEIPICFSTAAVGSLRREWVPGSLVVCSDFIDATSRNVTLFDNSAKHTDVSHPYGLSPNHLVRGAERIGTAIETGGIYCATNGPRYESAAEIVALGRLGANLVGMTATTEAIVFREAGVSYECLAIVTNLAAGLNEEVLSHHDVVDVMKGAGEAAVKVLTAAVSLL